MRVKQVLLTFEALKNMLQEYIANLPDDMEIVRITEPKRGYGRQVEVHFISETFDDIPEGATPPLLDTEMGLTE